MPIAPLPPVGALGAATGPAAAGAAAPAQGFGDALSRGLTEVSSMERASDAVARSLATGGTAQVSDLMIAQTKSQVSLDLLVATRNRAVEAYQEIMRLQV
jgi:flagellar hook-basal body complex protein FliE